MPRTMHSGKARISIRRPRAMGECDVCGFWHSLDDMIRQFQWAGNRLMDTGLLVGRDCLDVPQAQFRAPILPADPMPRHNSRPSYNVTNPAPIGGPLATSPENQGFTRFILGIFVPANVFILDQSRTDGTDVLGP